MFVKILVCEFCCVKMLWWLYNIKMFPIILMVNLNKSNAWDEMHWYENCLKYWRFMICDMNIKWLTCKVLDTLNLCHYTVLFSISQLVNWKSLFKLDLIKQPQWIPLFIQVYILNSNGQLSNCQSQQYMVNYNLMDKVYDCQVISWPSKYKIKHTFCLW